MLKSFEKMLDSWFTRVHNNGILNNKSEDL
jgi:hypothetical protein